MRRLFNPQESLTAKWLLALAAAIVVAMKASLAFAAASEWVDHDHAQFRLISASDSAGRDGALSLGLHFKLAPGWKIYWRTPGDAGIPPSVDWSGSRNLESAELSWPVPYRFTLYGLDTFGYDEEVVFPIEASLAERGSEGASLKAAVSYLVCSDICVPHDGEVALNLPAGSGGPAMHAFLIDQALDLVPVDGGADGLRLESVALAGTVTEPEIEVVARSDVAFDAPDLLVEGPPEYYFGRPEVSLFEDGKGAAITIPTSRLRNHQGVLEGKRLVLTLTDGRRGLEQAFYARHEGMPGSDLETWLTMLGFALLGGLILNLMPCVLPVLSIKLLSVAGMAGRDRREIRIGFLASAAGILFTFLLLAAFVLGLKSAGMAIGWGIQFQDPFFLSTMAVVVALFAFNLFGLFEIPLPAWLGSVGGAGPSKGIAGHFMTGVLATVLATPCSAPFLGTAVGFALARGTPEILAIFAALGLGLALPYLAIAALPGLTSRLPKPGNWMIVLRKVLGLALLGTALWLLSVLAAQTGLAAAALAGGLLAAVALALALGKSLSRQAVTAGVLVLALGAVLAPAGFATMTAGQTGGKADAWKTLDLGEIDRLVSEGHVVFVDVTADWCLTCQVNKSLVIDRGDVAERLAGSAVTTMRGDWTLPSDTISDYLASFSRFGIPFNAVYGPGTPEGEPLPELLTSEAVLNALDRARGP